MAEQVRKNRQTPDRSEVTTEVTSTATAQNAKLNLIWMNFSMK